MTKPFYAYWIIDLPIGKYETDKLFIMLNSVEHYTSLAKAPAATHEINVFFIEDSNAYRNAEGFLSEETVDALLDSGEPWPPLQKAHHTYQFVAHNNRDAVSSISMLVNEVKDGVLHPGIEAKNDWDSIFASFGDLAEDIEDIENIIDNSDNVVRMYAYGH